MYLFCRSRVFYFWYMALVLALSILTVSCKSPVTPTAVKGILDLSSYSFIDSGNVAVQGTWKFRYKNSSESFAEIPSNWKDSVVDGQKAGAFGFAEYSIHVVLPSESNDLMLCLGEIGTASTVYLNGVVVARNGVPGKDVRGTTPSVRVRYIPIPQGLQTLDILIQAANYDDSNGGGVWGRIYLGTAEKIGYKRDGAIILDSVMTGIFLIVSLYYLVLFFYRRTDRTSLLFGLICFAFFLRQISTGEKILAMGFPSIPWRVLVRVEYFSLYSLAFLYLSFFRTLFSRRSFYRLGMVLFALAIALSVSVIFLPVPWFIATLIPFQIYLVFLFCYNYYQLILAVRDKKDDAVLLLASFSILLFAGINDILLTRLYIPTVSLATPAQAVFIFFQSIALSHRIAREDHQARNLAVQNTELLKLDEARLRFFTASSHELRTPVTLITTPLEAIMNGLYGDCIPCNASVFSLIKRNCDRLTHLANELLDFLRFDSGSVKITAQVIDLGDYLAGFVTLFASDAERRGIKLETAFLPNSVTRFDPVLMETVILNLLSNAMKHTPSGGTVTLSISQTQNLVSFSVSDTGEGISEDQIPYLFERFTASSSVHGTGYSGFGIGLPLSAEIVKSLGGTITVESQIGKGSSFTVSFPPFDGVTEKIVPPGNRFTEYLQGERREADSSLVPILLVDDDPDMLFFLEDTLSAKFNVHSASSGDAAIALIENGYRPRVIISDVMMPVMDGFALRERLNKMEACLGVPFLFLSAKADSEVKKTGLDTGAVDYILKPFSITELSSKIASLASLAQAERERLERRLAKALRSDASLDTPVSASASTPTATVDWRSRAVSLGMTDRDLEILTLVIRGMSDKEIASELECSSRTVSHRVSALLKKTNSSSRAGLIAYITRVG